MSEKLQHQFWDSNLFGLIVLCSDMLDLRERAVEKNCKKIADFQLHDFYTVFTLRIRTPQLLTILLNFQKVNLTSCSSV